MNDDDGFRIYYKRLEEGGKKTEDRVRGTRGLSCRSQARWGQQKHFVLRSLSLRLFILFSFSIFFSLHFPKSRSLSPLQINIEAKR